jgi:hypothetical protein
VCWFIKNHIGPEPYLFVLFSLQSVYCIDSFYTPKTAGESCGNSNDPNKEALAKTEVSLTLTNKFDVPGDENAEMDARTILLKWVLKGEGSALKLYLLGLTCPSQSSAPCTAFGLSLLVLYSHNLGNSSLPPLHCGSLLLVQHPCGKASVG